MNRRSLLAMTIGALAGAFGLKVVPAFAQPLRVGRDTVWTSPEAAAAIEPLVRDGVSMADLFVSESAEVSAVLDGPWVIHVPSPAGAPVITIGTLIIRTEAERDAFLQDMADLILRAWLT